jgi:hypothetical protein
MESTAEKRDSGISLISGMRVSGNPSWIDNKKDWNDFACYASEIDNVIGGAKLMVLCTCALKKCGVGEVLDVMKNHEFVLARYMGMWQIVNMPNCANGQLHN